MRSSFSQSCRNNKTAPSSAIPCCKLRVRCAPDCTADMKLEEQYTITFSMFPTLCQGISVPTHSCILAALSPYLSQKLSASVSPPSGQKHQLQLRAVKAQTLLKLVGLMYSGEVEVKGGVEQDDVLSAARQFGITDLVAGRKDARTKGSCGSCRERNRNRIMQDAYVQAEMTGWRDSLADKRSGVSTGTQTVKADEKTVDSSFTHQTKPLTQDPQGLDFIFTLQPQNTPLDNHYYSTGLQSTPSVPSGPPSDGESTLDRSTSSLTNPTSTSAWPSDVMTLLISPDDDSNSLTPRGDRCSQQSPESGDSTQGLAEEGKDSEDGDSNGNSREKAEEPNCADREDILGEKHACANVGSKCLAMMKQHQMVETTQISIKVRTSELHSLSFLHVDMNSKGFQSDSEPYQSQISTAM